MPMEIKLKCQIEGNSTKITVLIISERVNDMGLSQELDINGLAIVKFGFTQGTSNVKAKIMVRKKPLESNGKLLVYSQELKASYKMGYSENEGWYDLGTTDCCLKCRTMSVFLFDVTITATKVKSVVYDKLYNDTDFTDFQLSTDEGSVAVHKACLATQSEVFKKMLSQEWKETTDAKLHIDGVTLETLHHFKKYIYLGVLPDDGIKPLLSIASCYLLEDLKTECITKLSQNVMPLDFYKMLEYSMDNKLPELTFALIKATPKYVVESAEKVRINDEDVTNKMKTNE